MRFPWARGLSLALALLAVRAAASEPVTLPVSYTLDFETESDGVEIFSDDDVPIVKDGRLSQKHWTQVFGAAADPAHPDLFSRASLAHFTSRNAFRGNRSLWMRTHGEHLLVRSTQMYPLDEDVRRRSVLPPEARIRVTARVMTRSLSTGSLRVELLFFREDPQIEGRLVQLADAAVSSPPISGSRDWGTHVAFQTRVPRGADKFEVRILLEGAFEDRAADVWIDDMHIDIFPGCSIEWPGIDNQLVEPGEEIPLQVECHGLASGHYDLEIRLERQWPPGPAAPLSMRARRFVLAGKTLKMLEELRSELEIERGIYRVVVRVVDRHGRPAADIESHIAVIGEGLESFAVDGNDLSLTLGWVLRPGDPGARRTLADIRAGAREYPIHAILLRVDGVPGHRVPGHGVPGDRASGPRDALPDLGALSDSGFELYGSLRWEEGAAGRAASIFEKHLASIDHWAIELDGPRSAADDHALRALRESHPGLELGAYAKTRPTPEWASFRVFRHDEALREDTVAGPGDWAVIALPTGLGRNEKITFIGRLAFELIRRGFRRLFIESSWEEFARPLEEERFSSMPNPFLFGWIGSIRLLGSLTYTGSRDWGDGGRFLLFSRAASGDDVLVAYSRGEERLEHELWTGEPVTVVDFLGNRVQAPFDPRRGMTRFALGPLPIFIERFPARRVDTALSLERVTGRLEAWPRRQELIYRVTSSLAGESWFSLELEAPEDWTLDSPARRRRLAPGETWDAAWTVEFSEHAPVLADHGVLLRLAFEHQGAVHRRALPDLVPLRSDVVTVEFDAVPPDAEVLLLRVTGRPDGEVERLNLFAQAFVADGASVRRSWSGLRLIPGEERRLPVVLPVSADRLAGRAVRVGYQVRGRGDLGTFEFLATRRDGAIVLEPVTDRAPTGAQ